MKTNELKKNVIKKDMQNYTEILKKKRYYKVNTEISTVILFLCFFLEEELKRMNAEKNVYNQVGFTYDDSSNSKESSSKITEGKFLR
jgi:hypothetical protein